MGSVTNTASHECRAVARQAGEWLVAAGLLAAILAIFVPFLAIELTVWTGSETTIVAVHAGAGICAIGLVLVWLADADRVATALVHPMALAAFFVAGWSALVAPLSDYPWLSLLGTQNLGIGALRFFEYGVLFAGVHTVCTVPTLRRLLLLVLAAVAIVAPFVYFVWRPTFFVHVDFLGLLPIPAAVAVWSLLADRPIAWRLAATLAAVAPSLAVSDNTTAVAVVPFIAGPTAIAAYLLLRDRPGRVPVIRALTVAAVLLAPVVGLVFTWVAPDLADLPSIQSRKYLNNVLYAALQADLSIVAFGQGWGQVGLSFREFLLASGADIWAGQWDLLNRPLTHAHSQFVEALFGGGLPAFAGFTAMLAAPVLGAPAARLPIAVFCVIAFAGMAPINEQFPFTVGAVAVALALAGGAADLFGSTG